MPHSKEFGILDYLEFTNNYPSIIRGTDYMRGLVDQLED